MVGQVFLLISLGLNSLPRSCVLRAEKQYWEKVVQVRGRRPRISLKYIHLIENASNFVSAGTELASIPFISEITNTSLNILHIPGHWMIQDIIHKHYSTWPTDSGKFHLFSNFFSKLFSTVELKQIENEASPKYSGPKVSNYSNLALI